MKYRAHIYIDFSGNTWGKRNRRSQQLIAALIQAGWKLMATRSFVIETNELAEVFRGIELVAKQSGSLGPISFCNFQIQGISDPKGLEYTAAKSQPNALREISSKPYPIRSKNAPPIDSNEVLRGI